MAPADNTLLMAALDYAERGFPVFPLHNPISNDGGLTCSCANPKCESKAKHPRTAHGFKDATTDVAVIKEWWSRWPNANIGIPTGAASGFDVIDLDNEQAQQKLKELIPDTSHAAVAKTGRGWQLAFSHVESGLTTASEIGDVKGLDFRGTGGYIVAAPSQHITGKHYEWVRTLSGDLPTLPDSFIKFAAAPINQKTGFKERFDSSVALLGVSEGERHDKLMRLVCSLRAQDIPQDLAVEMMAFAFHRSGYDEETPEGLIGDIYGRYPAGNGGQEFVSAPREKNVRKETLTLQTWADFVAMDHGGQAFTVDGIAPDYGLVAFHGRGKGGKTTFLIHGGRSIAAGETFLERATVKKPVVYLNYEMTYSYPKELLIAGGPSPEEAYILNRPEPVLQIATVEALIEQVGKPGVLVIDSFRGAFRLAGDAENSAGGAGVILRNLQDLAIKHKWLIIVVHHSNRSQREGTDGVSGTSDWIAAPDVIWTWQRPDKTKPGVLHIEGRMPPVDPLAVDLSPEKCLFVGTVEESQKETDNKKILAALTEEGQSSEVIAEMIGRPAGTVRKRLEALFDQKLVGRDGEGKRGNPHLYSKSFFPHAKSLSAETNRTNGNGHADDGWKDVPRR